MNSVLAPADTEAAAASSKAAPIRVQLESPYAADNDTARGLNQLYLRAALRDSLLRGEAPFASHALYAQRFVLDDNVPAERALGIAAGLAFLNDAEKVVVYVDRGISEGMQIGIRRALDLGLNVEERSLPEWRRGFIVSAAPPSRDNRILSQYVFAELTLVNGVTLAGEWTFTSDGSTEAFPRFVGTAGEVVFLHAVAHAKEKKP